MRSLLTVRSLSKRTETKPTENQEIDSFRDPFRFTFTLDLLLSGNNIEIHAVYLPDHDIQPVCCLDNVYTSCLSSVWSFLIQRENLHAFNNYVHINLA